MAQWCGFWRYIYKHNNIHVSHLAQKYVRQLVGLLAAEIELVWHTAVNGSWQDCWHVAVNSTCGRSPKSAGDSILSSCYRFTSYSSCSSSSLT
jgi:hypothetical protein